MSPLFQASRALSFTLYDYNMSNTIAGLEKNVGKLFILTTMNLQRMVLFKSMLKGFFPGINTHKAEYVLPLFLSCLSNVCSKAESMLEMEKETPRTYSKVTLGAATVLAHLHKPANYILSHSDKLFQTVALASYVAMIQQGIQV